MVSTIFSVEIITNEAHLFYGVDRNILVEQNFKFSNETDIPFNVFRSNKDSMSMNWEKYSTARQLKDDKDRGKPPDFYSIIKFIAGNLRNDGMNVEHDPEDNNQSHTAVKGLEGLDKTRRTTLRRKLARHASWAILVNAQPISN